MLFILYLSIYHYVSPSLFLDSLCFKVCIVWYKYCHLALSFHLHGISFFFPSLSMCVCVCASEVKLWSYICRPYFFIHSAILCLLIEAFSPFTFKVLIYRYLLNSTLFIVLIVFVILWSFLLLFSFPFDLMTFFRVIMYSFLCVCVSVIGFWFIVIIGLYITTDVESSLFKVT